MIYMKQLTNTIVRPTRIHNHGKYDSNGKGLYSLFEDDDMMSYKDIPSITWT